jgi:hypothetical protein
MMGAEGYVILTMICGLILVAAFKIAKAIGDERTEVDWSQMISAEGKGGRQFISASKVCLLLTFFLSTLLITWIAFQVDWRERATEVVLLIGTWIFFGSGVEAYSKWRQVKGEENGDVKSAGSGG